MDDATPDNGADQSPPATAAHHRTRPAGNYTFESPENFGADADEAKQAFTALLSKPDANGKTYLSTPNPSEGSLINALEDFLSDRTDYNYSSQYMDDRSMGTRLRSAMITWANAGGANIAPGASFGDAAPAIIGVVQKFVAGLGAAPATGQSSATDQNVATGQSSATDQNAAPGTPNPQTPSGAQDFFAGLLPQTPAQSSTPSGAPAAATPATASTAPTGKPHSGPFGWLKKIGSGFAAFGKGAGHALATEGEILLNGTPGSPYTTQVLIPGRVPPRLPQNGMGNYAGNAPANYRTQMPASQPCAVQPGQPLSPNQMSAEQLQYYEAGQRAGTAAGNIQPGYAKPFNDQLQQQRQQLAQLPDKSLLNAFDAGYNKTFNNSAAGDRYAKINAAAAQKLVNGSGGSFLPH